MLHLKTCEESRGSAWTFLAYLLQSKIVNSEPISAPIDEDMVIGGSVVTYSVGGGPPVQGSLLHRVRPEISKGEVISVASLLGATLIGMRTGQRSPLLCDDGSIKSLLVIDTVPPA
jgi:transcription elongation GreA/GreB family factor